MIGKTETATRNCLEDSEAPGRFQKLTDVPGPRLPELLAYEAARPAEREPRSR